MHIPAGGFGIGWLGKARPTSAKPVSGIGFIVSCAGEFLLERLHIAHGVFVRPVRIDNTLGLKPFGVQAADGGVALDDFIHQWLREAGLVAFIVAKAAVAPHVDDDVAVECLAEFDRNFTCEGHRFGIITIDVEYWRLNAFCDV